MDNIVTLPLSQGRFCIIDAEDSMLVGQHKWTLYRKPGNPNGTCYAYRCIKEKGKQRTEFIHRAIMRAPKGMEVDHINGDGLDNRKCNLRLATSSQNRMNRETPRRNTSGRKGVCWDKRKSKWKAQIVINRKNKFLGNFTDINDAAAAYREAAKTIHKTFARI